VIRVWIEKNGGTRLRSRITSVLDVYAAQESSTFAATPDEIAKAVGEWLDAFLRDASVTAR
jgi:hypothetical protein